MKLHTFQPFFEILFYFQIIDCFLLCDKLKTKVIKVIGIFFFDRIISIPIPLIDGDVVCKCETVRKKERGRT